jgi:NAD(P)-dependent dehydrogenase (short-subunit alcohol dehydrogenase family)
MRLRGKNAFVTGGSRGIGKSICMALAKEGANISFTYLEQSDAAQNTYEELCNFGVDVSFFQCDVKERNDIRKAVQKLKANCESIDVLVNNAGINKPTDFNQITDEDWDNILSVNLKGPFIVTQEMLPLLITNGSSSVINIGSVSGQYGGPRTAHYAASKAGLISLGQVIARFGAEYGIRCNTIAAGIIASEMGAEGLKSPLVTKATESIILKRLGSFEEIANAVTFLASDESSYITAQTINVNGGIYF